MSTEAVPSDLSILLLAEHPPEERHPALVYLAHRAPRSRARAREALNTIAALLTAGQGTLDVLAWHQLRDDHVSGLRSALGERYPAPAAGRILATLRGVLKRCWQLGLMPTEDYRRAHAAAADGSAQVSRGELRSVFESCGDDGSPAPERGGAVRTLLYGNGVKQGTPMTTGGAPQRSSPSVRGNALSREQLHLRRVAPREAIAHALWEAGVCVRSSAFCASLAMLRKALDLWSADYQERHGLDGERARGGDDLAWRLTKIAGENKLYSTTIHAILGTLSHDARDPHAGIVCRGGYATSYDGYAVMRIKESYRNLHELVVTLITATTPDLPL